MADSATDAPGVEDPAPSNINGSTEDSNNVEPTVPVNGAEGDTPENGVDDAAPGASEEKHQEAGAETSPAEPATLQDRILQAAFPSDEARKQSVRSSLDVSTTDLSIENPHDELAARLRKANLDLPAYDLLSLLNLLDKLSGSPRLLRFVSTQTQFKSLRDLANEVDPQMIEENLEPDKKHLAPSLSQEIFQAELKGALSRAWNGIKDRPSATGVDAETASSRRSSRQPEVQFLSKTSAMPPDHTDSATMSPSNAVIQQLLSAGVVTNQKVADHLTEKGITSAFAISQMPKSDFIATAHSSGDVKKTAAAETYEMATMLVHRNQEVLANLHSLYMERNTGLLTDGNENGEGIMMLSRSADAASSSGNDDGTDSLKMEIQEQMKQYGLNLSLEDLFGPMEYSVDDESQTVYSPSSYFVDLLMYLRNNNIDKDHKPDNSVKGQSVSLAGTVLEKLFRRRPDLADLELTSQNTNTTIPYIDLVNEVMEAFIVNFPVYMNGTNVPRQADIKAYNVRGQSSDDLLSQPQNVRIEAYRILAASAYPATLPYHQPLDVQRVFLSFLGTSKLEILRHFRPKALELHDRARAAHDYRISMQAQTMQTASEELDSADKLLATYQARALDAQYFSEILGLCQEEFLIWTKEVFWPREHFILTEGLGSLSDDEYRRRVGFRQPWQLWGYKTAEEMLSNDKAGVRYVKDQLLSRAGIQYTELIEILKTGFVNAFTPQGRDSVILQSLPFSYRYLQTLIDNKTYNSYERIAEFVSKDEKTLKAMEKLWAPRGRNLEDSTFRLERDERKAKFQVELKRWILRNFQRMGKMIVLESGQEPRLQFTGVILATQRDPLLTTSLDLSSNFTASFDTGQLLYGRPSQRYRTAIVATISHDGTVVGENGKIGSIDEEGYIFYGNPLDNICLTQRFPNLEFSICSTRQGLQSPDLAIEDSKLVRRTGTPESKGLIWSLPKGPQASTNIDDVKLMHLDGSALNLDEWDRLHRFVRIWRKMKWSVSDTDRALSCPHLSPDLPPNHVKDPNKGFPGDHEVHDIKEKRIRFHDFIDQDKGRDEERQLPSEPQKSTVEITIATVQQLAAIKEILTLTSLSIEELLTLWTPMSSRGPRSQFERLFGKRSVRGDDTTFNPDEDGNYFTASAGSQKILDYKLAVTAALGLKNAELEYLLSKKEAPVIRKELDMRSLSQIYACCLLAKVLAVRVTDLHQIVQAFGNPFTGPSKCLEFLKRWKKVVDASFTWPQTRFIVEAVSSVDDPFNLTQLDSLKLTKQLRDNVLGIQTTYPLEVDASSLTSDYVQKITSLLLQPQTVTSILSLLQGTAVYAATAPLITDSNFPEEVQKCSTRGVSYKTKGDKGFLSVTGIMSDMDVQSLKLVITRSADFAQQNGQTPQAKPNAHPLFQSWDNAVVRLMKRPEELLLDSLVGILPSEILAREKSSKERMLLAPDVNPSNKGTKPPDAPHDKNASVNGVHGVHAHPAGQANGVPYMNGTDNTVKPDAAAEQTGIGPDNSQGLKPAEKIKFFLKHYTPYLHKRLTYDSVVETVASVAGFKDIGVLRTLLESVIRSPLKDAGSALDFVIKSVNNSINLWQGYLIVPNDGRYTFMVEQEKKPEPVLLIGLKSGSQMDGALFDDEIRRSAFLDQIGKSKEDRPQIVELEWQTDGMPTGSFVTKEVELVGRQKYALRLPNLLRTKMRRQLSAGYTEAISEEWWIAWWKGYLCPTTSDVYAFSCQVQGKKTRPGIVFNNQYLHLEEEVRGDDAISFWTTGVKDMYQKLNAATLYPLELTGILPGQLPLSDKKQAVASQLFWKVGANPRKEIPDTSLLPDIALGQMGDILTKLRRLSIFFENLPLSPQEILFIRRNSKKFSGFDKGNTVTDLDGIHVVQDIIAIRDYVDLRDAPPQNTNRSLLDLLNWAINHEERGKNELTVQLCLATGWPRSQVKSMLSMINHEGVFKAADFQNISILVQFQKMISLSSMLDVDIETLFRWASPLGTNTNEFEDYHQVAQEIQKVAKSRFDQDAWTQAVRPLNNIIRENQKKGLISFLLAQDQFVRENNIVDADSLYEFFLIDVQMTPLVETSRIVQATSTVQLFIQRCFLGLETKNGVNANSLNRERWNWMSKYRVWEANRKIYLYPENWIEPSLRDNKSVLFKELESELLQKSISAETLNSAFKKFLFGIANIANLVAVGLYVSNDNGNELIHVFARTRQTPFTYYHNVFSPSGSGSGGGVWAGWQAMDIEIPYIVSADQDGASGGNYLAPIVFGGRLILFVAEMLPRTITSPVTSDSEKVIAEIFWEIKMSWTELRDGRWTVRQTCPSSYISTVPGISAKEFLYIPSAVQSKDEAQKTIVDKVVVHLACAKTIGPTQKDTRFVLAGRILAAWVFDGVQFSTISVPVGSTLSDVSFGKTRKFGVIEGAPGTCMPLQATQDVSTPHEIVLAYPSPDNSRVYIEDADSLDGHKTTVGTGPFIHFPKTSKDGSTRMRFYNNSISILMAASARAEGLSSVLKELNSIGIDKEGNVGTITDELKETFGAFVSTPQQGKGGQNATIGFNEQSSLYSLYNWELGLHAPMILIDRLFKDQQFELALRVAHTIFDPRAEGTDTRRFWKFAPFKTVTRTTVEDIFLKLKAGEFDQNIAEWRDNPFQPHVVARSRPQAYMKWIVKTYIKILIAWGDSLFRQNSLESIPQAIQLYVLASHIYGPRGYAVPRQTKIKPQTFSSLCRRFDAFSNAMVQLERIPLFSKQTPHRFHKGPSGKEVQIPNIFGTASGLYFSIPDNPDVRALATTIEDRLFKIRNSQDIDGKFRQLALFEPSIDPALLVQAAAQGLSLGSVLQDLQGPLPNCKFHTLVQKAFELINETKSLGQSLVSIREKRDAELLSAIRQRHEMSMQMIMMDSKKLALQEANQNLENLHTSRKAAESRFRHYLRLVGKEESGIPDIDREFQELDVKIEKPVSDGGLGLSPMEDESMKKQSTSQELNTIRSGITIAAGIMHVLPNIDISASPMGVGAVTRWGPKNLAAMMEIAAQGVGIASEIISNQGQMAGLKGQHQRTLQDRILQANSAGHEIVNINKQIIASRIRIAMASKEIATQQKQIDQTREISDFLRDKYSNAELYGWMDGMTKTLYHQFYTEAFALAKKAELAFKYERPQLSGKTFIKAGYFNDSRSGLLAGESLLRDLRNLEIAYMNDRGYDFEIVKSISLRMLNPIALIKLREDGSCEFALDEILFDMDFPGHYLRRIKSVSLTIPCVVGPYTSVNATLSLRSSEYRVKPHKEGQYPKEPSSGPVQDVRFATASTKITSIAVSTAQNDTGTFQLDFNDQSSRYLPFEGAGVISKWTLSLPKHHRQFDYGTIHDVVMQLKYTSIDGGEDLREAASVSVAEYFARKENYAKSVGLAAIFDVKNEYSTAWSRAMSQATPAHNSINIELGDLRGRLPFFTHSHSVEATKVHLFLNDKTSNPTVLSGDQAYTFKSSSLSDMTHYTSDDSRYKFGDKWSLKFDLGPTKPTKCVMVVEYAIK